MDPGEPGMAGSESEYAVRVSAPRNVVPGSVRESECFLEIRSYQGMDSGKEKH
jgi:hypothetical protein